MESPYLTRDEVAALLVPPRTVSRRATSTSHQSKYRRPLPQGQVARMARKRGYQVTSPGATAYYVRFRHEGHRHNVSLRTEDPGEADRAAALIYAETISGQRQPQRSRYSRSRTAAADGGALAGLAGRPRRTRPAHAQDLRRPRAPMVPLRRVGARDRPDQRRVQDVPAGSAGRGHPVQRAQGGRRAARVPRWCKEQGCCARCRTSLPSRAPGTRQKERRAVLLSPEEVAALLAHLPEWSPRPTRTEPRSSASLHVEFLYETGLRAPTVERLIRGKAWDQVGGTSCWRTTRTRRGSGARCRSRRAVALLEEHARRGRRRCGAGTGWTRCSAGRLVPAGWTRTGRGAWCPTTCGTPG